MQCGKSGLSVKRHDFVEMFSRETVFLNVNESNEYKNLSELIYIRHVHTVETWMKNNVI